MKIAIVKKYIFVGLMGSSLLGAGPAANDVQQVVFENINLQRVQSKCAVYEKKMKCARYAQGALLAAGGIAAAYLTYGLLYSNKTPVSQKATTACHISEEEKKKQDEDLEFFSKKELFYFLKNKKNTGWFNGFSFDYENVTDFCKKIFMFSILTALSTSVANGILAPVNQFVMQHYSKLYGLLSVGGQSSFVTCEQEIENTTNNLSLFACNLVLPDQGGIDASYLVGRITSAHTTLITTLEDFLAVIACRACSKKDFQTYNWILDSENGVMESTNVLSQRLSEFVHLKDARKELLEPVLADLNNLRSIVNRCGVIATKTQ